MPSISELILNPGGGFNLSVDPGPNGVWARGGYQYGPSTQPLIGYEAALDLTDNHVQVDLYPSIVYRHLISMDVGIRNPSGGGWASFIAELPITPKVGSERNITLPRTSLLTSIGADWQPNPRHELRLAYLHTVGGFGETIGPVPVTGGSLFESRFPFRRAASLGWQGSLRSWGATVFSVNSQAIYDFSVQGFWAQPEARLRIGEGLTFTLGADLLVANLKETPILGGGDFIGRNQMLDRIRWAVQFVF